MITTGGLLAVFGYHETPIILFYIAYVTITIMALTKNGLMSFSSIFILGFTLFAGSKILIRPFETNVTYYVGTFSISQATNVATTGLWVWILYLFLLPHTSTQYIRPKINKRPVNVITISLFVICIAFVMLKSFMLANIINNQGYQALYDQGTGLDTTIARFLTILLASIIIYRNPKTFLRCKYLILLFAAGYLMTGVRANALILLMMMLYASNDLSIKKRYSPILYGLTIIGLMLLVQWYRQGFTWASNQNLLFYIIDSQNKTFFLPGILFEQELNGEAAFSILSFFSKIFCDECTSGHILSRYIMGALSNEGHGVGGIGFFDVLITTPLIPIGSFFILLLGSFLRHLEGKQIKYLFIYPILFLLFYSHRSNVGYYLIILIIFYIILSVTPKLIKAMTEMRYSHRDN